METAAPAQVPAQKPSIVAPHLGRRAPSNVDKRQRKREADRVAQRTSRERTKLRMAQLERMVGILSAKNDNTAAHELMGELARQAQEIERLRRIIGMIKTALRDERSYTEHCPPSPNQDAPFNGEGNQDDQIPDNKYKDTKGLIQNDDTSSAIELEQDSETEGVLASLSKTANAEHSSGHVPAHTSSCTSGRLHGGTLHMNTWWHSSLASNLVDTTNVPDGSRSLDWLNPKISPVPEMARHRSSVKCNASWERCNVIYGKIFNINSMDSSSASESRINSLFKAVKKGWNCLSIEEQGDRTLGILREVDEEILLFLDPVTRFAVLQKSHMLLTYYLNAEADNWKTMPTWLRPSSSQLRRAHPMAIDFFAWPGIRDRLLVDHEKYFITNDFSLHYQTNLRFNWPFSFEDTYTYCQETDIYQPTSLFQRYFSNINSWGMGKSFFDRFPEFRDHVPLSLMELLDEPSTRGQPSPPSLSKCAERDGPRDWSPIDFALDAHLDSSMIDFIQNLPPVA